MTMMLNFFRHETENSESVLQPPPPSSYACGSY